MANRVEVIKAREHKERAPAIRDLKAMTRLNYLVNAALQTESPDDDVDGEILYDLATALEYLGLQVAQLHEKQPGASRSKGRRMRTEPPTRSNLVALPPRAGV